MAGTAYVLAHSKILDEAGGRGAASFQPQVFRFHLDASPLEKKKTVSDDGKLKKQRNHPAVLQRHPESPKTVVAAKPDLGKKPRVAPSPTQPKAHDATPAAMPSPAQLSPDVQLCPQVILTTVRGGRHEDYASIVFEYSGKIDYGKPQIQSDEIRFQLKNAMTCLRSYRRYTTFDSWVRMGRAGNDISVHIGLPPGFIRFSNFVMKDPPRLVFNLYDKRALTDFKAREPSASAGGVLMTIRGGRHENHASIVFQCSGEIAYEKPRVQGDEIWFRFKNMRTQLRSFRKYNSFESWVRLEKAGDDLNVRIGLPPGFKNFSAFKMKTPPRLVVNIYDKDLLKASFLLSRSR